MIGIKDLRYVTVLSLSLLLPILTISSSATQAAPSKTTPVAPQKISLNFKAPDRGSPASTTGGATRGGVCMPGPKVLMPLIPKQKIGLTVSDHPSFFLYIPQSPNQTAEFLLLANNDSEVVYQDTFSIPAKAGIVRFDLPATVPPLQAGKQYHWYVTLICDTTRGPSGNPTVEGWVERVQPSPALAKALKTKDPASRPALFAEAGVWHESLSSVADLLRKSPNNPKLLSDWNDLLKSVGLETVAKEPMFDCCMAKKP
jgi:hypothetical protein